MVYKHVTLAATITVLSQISHVSAWAYGLGILHNQDVTNVDGDGYDLSPITRVPSKELIWFSSNWIISATSGATCFSDVPAKCGECGTAYTSPPSASMDITEPGTFNTNACGNPCVTYNSSGMVSSHLNQAPTFSTNLIMIEELQSDTERPG